jgi:putative heme-binding domain-containing protein
LGEFGLAAPWGDKVRPSEGATAGRFRIDPTFRVERVAHPQRTGSLIAMTFNEWGDILASRESGAILLLRDNDGNGTFETLINYSEEVKSCQGLLALNGQVFAVGDGPDGAAFYRLSDEDRDDKADKIDTLFKFTEGINEHGPHAPVLGPDGLIYLIMGNHARPDKPFSSTSPYHHEYEGDLVQPRYEDPQGFGTGVKAPGGMVIRTDQNGSVVELVAGGLRNAYDMAFNAHGELFTSDSDMESDEGLPWFRNTRITHLVPGGEYGWRSGWALWPDYLLDSLPGVAQTGRGSPTGIEFYNHYRYPEALRDAMFIGDWSRGRILLVRLKPLAGSYEAKAEVFLEGQPLNVTDLAVGRDGWLYFATGGRGTEGGVYRVVFTGKVPAPPKSQGLAQALRQPQLHSAWAREQLAILKDELGPQWDRQLNAVLTSSLASPDERTRALDLMQLLGPYPSAEMLIKLASADHQQVRAKAAYLMGLHPTRDTNNWLVALLGDADPTVRRTACEALARSQYQGAAFKLVPVLADQHRHVAYAARRALEQTPVEDWRGLILAHTSPAVFNQGAIALMTMAPTRDNAEALLNRASELMRGYLSDDDFVGMLRAIEVTLLRAEIKSDEVVGLRKQLADEYPALEPRLNRELVRLLVYLDEPSALDRMLAELQGEAPDSEKLHLAMHLRFLKSGWTSQQKLDMLEFYEQAREMKGGSGLARYIETAARDFCGTFTPEEREQVVANAMKFPSSALAAVIRLPEKLDEQTIDDLIALDSQLINADNEPKRQLSIGVVAVLARSRHPRAFAYLRELYEKDPPRRATLAMGLAQEPGGENWTILVRSLSIAEGPAAQDILTALAKVNLAPEQPEPYRQAILSGLKLKGDGGLLAVALLEKWTGQSRSQSGDKWDVALAAWQRWFTETYPNQPEPKLPVESDDNKWSLEELVKYLGSPAGKQGDASGGAIVFEKAQCIKCHRYGQRGETIGPDLSTVARRFQQKEILESVLYPSHVISDQYASKTLVTRDGLTYTGLVSQLDERTVVVLEANGRKTQLPRSDIEDLVPHKKSAMPEGLFNSLTLEEIGDLFAYLGEPSGTLATRPAATERK